MTRSQNPKLLEDSTYLAKITCSIFRTRWKVPHILQQYLVYVKAMGELTRLHLRFVQNRFWMGQRALQARYPLQKQIGAPSSVAFVVYDTQLELDDRREIICSFLYSSYTLNKYIKYFDDKLTHCTHLCWPMAMKLKKTVTGSYC